MANDTKRSATPEQEPVRRRVWVQYVAVNAAVLQARLDAIEARRSQDPSVAGTIAGVRNQLTRALQAAYRENPIPARWTNWWRGSLIEAAYQHLHAAEAEITVLYNNAEVDAEVSDAIARVEAGLNRDDPRRASALRLRDMKPGPDKNAHLRKVIEIGHGASDRQYTRIRSFRNIVFAAAILIALFVAIFVFVVAQNPSWVPLCFQDAGTSTTSCPTRMVSADSDDAAAPEDVQVVALLGMTGGAVAAAVAIRNMRGTSTPYGVPVALAALKVPLGALTALVALIAIRGDFVPGLSALDSQEQILAYAIAFGFAQQILTTKIDSRGKELLESVPSKDPETPRRAALQLTPTPT